MQKRWVYVANREIDKHIKYKWGEYSSPSQFSQRKSRKNILAKNEGMIIKYDHRVEDRTENRSE